MGNISWEDVQTIIDEVLDLPEEKRMTFVEKRCEGSKELKAEVTHFLKSIFDSEGWLENRDTYKEHVLNLQAESFRPSVMSGEKIGAYRIKHLIGHGGMGSVFLAERDDGTFQQTVAMKLIRREMATPSNKARFKREQQILAGLTHANIARLYDGGVTSEGLPYLVMEYIDGKPITTFCDENRLTITERVELFKQVCKAVQHAHSNLIIHRDLKPDNILVTKEGQVKILDFGIAKLLDTDDSDLLQTIEGHRLLTLRYAAPEQIKNTALTTAADTYTLGNLLYILIAGVHPFELKGKKISEAELIIRDMNPLHPSKHFSSLPDRKQHELAEKRSASPAEVGRKLNSDLSFIILKTLRKEPEARYESVGKFLEDLDRFGLDLPVAAREGTVQYQLGKFTKRHRTGLTVTAIFVLMIISFGIFYTWQITEERNFAQSETEKAQAVKDFLITMITRSNPWISPGEPPTARDLIDQGAQAVEEELENKPALAAEIFGVIGASYQGMREDELAEQYLSQSMELIEDGTILDPLTVADIHAKYAGALLRSSQPEEAATLAQQALDGLSDQEGSGKVRSELLSMLANAQSLLGNPPDAVTNAENAANLVCNSTGEYFLQCMNALMDLKNFYEWAGDYEAGLKAAEHAYQLSDTTESGVPDPVRLAVAGTYGNALSINAKSEQAIPLLRQNTELAQELYGENSYRYARALYDLSSAYQYAGRVHDALPSSERVFEIGGTAQAGNPMNSYWLHRIFHLALDLRMPERAEEAYEKYAYALPEMMSSYYEDAFEVEHLRLQALSNPGSAEVQAQVLALLGQFQEKGSPLTPDAALLAAEYEIEAGDSEAAEDLMVLYHATIGDTAASDIRPFKAMLLDARRLALQNELDQATEKATQALTLLQQKGHQNSPFVAETNAVLAELHCRMGKPAEGKMLLDESIQYWKEIAGVPAGTEAMDRLAMSCKNL